MEIRFKPTYVSDDLHYAVGLIEGTGDFAMSVTDPTHIIMTDPEKWTPGTDPSAIFGLMEEEYNWKDTDLEKLDELAQRLRTDIPRDRLIGEKDGVRTKDRVETIDYGKYARYRKERNEKRRDEIISAMLAADELYMMYLGETGKPYVFGYNFILMYQNKEMVMEAGNEYRKRGLPLLVSTFTHDQYNKEDTKSIFQELLVMGYQTIMFVDSEKRQSMVLIKDIIKHADFVGQKNNLIYGNPAIDFAMTNLFQYLRTPNLTDRSDPEKFKETVQKQVAFLESRFIEALSDARFLVPTKALEDGKVTTPILQMNAKPKKAEGEAAPEANAEAPKTEETAPAKKFLPVFTNGMEFVSDKNKFQASIVAYDDILKMVRESKLDGFIINMKSKCAMPCGEERFKQVEDFRTWKAKMEERRKAEAEGDIEEPKEAAENAEDAPADTPFVPIVNKD